jgi:hypothetical protein
VLKPPSPKINDNIPAEPPHIGHVKKISNGSNFIKTPAPPNAAKHLLNTLQDNAAANGSSSQALPAPLNYAKDSLQRKQANGATNGSSILIAPVPQHHMQHATPASSKRQHQASDKSTFSRVETLQTELRHIAEKLLPRPRSGFPNPRNSCFMNAALQVFEMLIASL